MGAGDRGGAAAHDLAVTVVIPAWGAHARTHLARAVTSAQHPQVRVLVVDNADDRPVTVSCDVIRIPQRVSLGAARNAGLQDVTTPYVPLLDADDELLPGAIDDLLDAVSAPAPRPVVAAGRLRDAVTGAGYHWPRAWQQRMAAQHRLFAILETIRAAYPVQGSLLPTDVVRECGGYADADNAAEDWVLGVSLAWRCDIRPATGPTMQYAPTRDGRWDDARSLRSQPAHRRHVRARLRSDPQARAIKAWLPVLTAVQALGAVRESASSALRRRSRMPPRARPAPLQP